MLQTQFAGIIIIAGAQMEREAENGAKEITNFNLSFAEVIAI